MRRRKGSSLLFCEAFCGGVKLTGLKNQPLHPASEEDAENVITCDVIRAIENLNEMILLLKCGSGESSYCQLNISMEKEEWNNLGNKENVRIKIEPENVLVMDR